MASIACFSFLRGLFTVSGLPAVNIGDIRIEGAGSPAKTFLVDFPTVDFGGNAFRFVPVFGYTVQNIVCSVMVNHASPNIVAVTVPLGFITLGVQYVGDIAAQYLVALPPAIPQPLIGKHHDNAVNVLVQVMPFVIQIAAQEEY